MANSQAKIDDATEDTALLATAPSNRGKKLIVGCLVAIALAGAAAFTSSKPSKGIRGATLRSEKGAADPPPVVDPLPTLKPTVWPPAPTPRPTTQCDGMNSNWWQAKLKPGTNYAVSKECTSYNGWRASLTGKETCISVEANGAKQTCTNPTAVAQITKLIKSGTGGSQVDCDGIPWTVGECGAGHTCFYANGAGNTCAPAGPDSVIVRPCISNGFWGGGNGPTCDGPTQMFTVKTG